jgi:hypothetical protein
VTETRPDMIFFFHFKMGFGFRESRIPIFYSPIQFLLSSITLGFVPGLLVRVVN